MNLNVKYLKDYKEPNFYPKEVELTFNINNNKTVEVTANISYYKNPKLLSSTSELVLNGTAELLSISLNNEVLNSSLYTLNNDSLVINNLPNEFSLQIVTLIKPWLNQSCSGLYASKENLYTQCEPEGFRRITYYQDRPDVMAIFTTHIIANQDEFPIALSNGNKIKEELLSNNKKLTSWHDPYKKPSYLFALVAGKLDLNRDFFITKSGRKVNLEIYVMEHDLPYTNHALESLKKAMKWDEERFNLEYDLDTYMIVAVDDFNMGAMENKGLNIFNSHFVLASKDTATDQDFVDIEAVIGHEYFHNWTGNRVTCRDWFQLSLKEGLTVFRDQEFSSSLHNRGVLRIANVNYLRAFQFPEDLGALAHPVRPSSYVEINNFYTTTIYEKGAEIVKMYQTILGPAKFNEGVKLYLKRHDGTAATCDDFFQTMRETSPISLDGFMLWYEQAGTPIVQVTSSYNSNAQEYTLEFTQYPPHNQPDNKPVLIPIKIALFDEFGHEYTDLSLKQDLKNNNNYVYHEDGLILLIREKQHSFTFEKVKFKPTPSLCRDFSAPIKLEYNHSDKELLLLAKHENDGFNQFECLHSILIKLMRQIYEQVNSTGIKEYCRNFSPELIKKISSLINEDIWQTLSAIANNPNLSAEFRALTLKVPSFNEMLTSGLKNISPISLTNAINIFTFLVGEKLFDSWMEIYNLNLTNIYNFDDHGKRSLKNLALYYILKTLYYKLDNPTSLSLIETLALGQYNNADNLTDKLGVLNSLKDLSIDIRLTCLESFYNTYLNFPLVINKWLSLQALSEVITIEDLNRLMVDKTFNPTNPNKIYALVRNFASNGLKFNNLEGYEFIADQIIAIDKFNPQVASSIARKFNQIQYLDAKWQTLARHSINRILSTPNLSLDVKEILTKFLLLNV